MAIVFTNARIIIGGYDLSASFNRVALDNSAQALDETAFGDTTRKMRGGLRTGRITGGGYWRAAATSSGVDPAIFEAFALDGKAALLFPDGIVVGATATGSGYGLKVEIGKYTPLSGNVGDLIMFTLDAEGQGV